MKIKHGDEMRAARDEDSWEPPGRTAARETRARVSKSPRQPSVILGVCRDHHGPWKGADVGGASSDLRFALFDSLTPDPNEEMDVTHAR